MRLLVTGGQGMLARTLVSVLSTMHTVHSPGRAELDVTSPDSVASALAAFGPDVVLHCAAFTKVDQCEDDRSLAFAVNDEGSANVARICHQLGARLFAFSTDYVFAGDDGPYSEFDHPAGGVNVYGQSKWAGECAVRLACPDHVIARVSWLYGPGGPSFLHTMLQLHERGVPCIRVVNDQRGNPTSTLAVAGAVRDLLTRPDLRGTFHLTCEGEATWYEFATEIFAQAGLTQRVVPCTSEEYPTRAKRPPDSRLENKRLTMAGLTAMQHWREALRAFLDEEMPRLKGAQSV